MPDTRASGPPCPCGGNDYAACCGRFLDAGAIAPDAERLMRSRYTAYALCREDYLRATWHERTRPAGLSLQADGHKWLGLTIKRHTPLDADHAEVEFVARYKVGGRAFRLHETSRFVRENGRWLYVDGDLHE